MGSVARWRRGDIKRRGLRIDLLINNAGFGSAGSFASLPIERELEMIHLNVIAVVELTHWYLKVMIERGRGAIINAASIAASQPMPWMADLCGDEGLRIALFGGAMGRMP